MTIAGGTQIYCAFEMQYMEPSHHQSKTGLGLREQAQAKECLLTVTKTFTKLHCTKIAGSQRRTTTLNADRCGRHWMRPNAKRVPSATPDTKNCDVFSVMSGWKTTLLRPPDVTRPSSHPGT